MKLFNNNNILKISLIIFFTMLSSYQIFKEIKIVEHSYQLQFKPILNAYDYSNNNNIIDNIILNKSQNDSIKSQLTNNKYSEVISDLDMSSQFKFYRAVGSERNVRTLVLHTKNTDKEYALFMDDFLKLLNNKIRDEIISIELKEYDEQKKIFIELNKQNKTNKLLSTNYFRIIEDDSNTKLIYGYKGNYKDKPSLKDDLLLLGFVLNESKDFQFLDYKPDFYLQKIGDVELFKSELINTNKIIKILIMHLTVLITILFLIYIVANESRNSKK